MCWLCYLLIDDALQVLLAGRAQHAEDVVELVQIVLAREDGAVGQHLGQDAAYGPDVDGLGVALNTKQHISQNFRRYCYRRTS